jgi:hypothetical protein
MYRSYSKDPYWTNAKFDGICAKTGEPFKKGDRIFYYPNGRQCFAGQAAEDAAQDFKTCAEAEEYDSTGEANASW